jgi:hypothetical protein
MFNAPEINLTISQWFQEVCRVQHNEKFSKCEEVVAFLIQPGMWFLLKINSIHK